MGILDSLFGSSQTGQTTSGALSEGAQGVATDLFSKARSFANQPYTQYQGQRLAGLDPMQQQGIQAARGVSGEAGNLYDQMRAQLAGGQTPGMVPMSGALAGDIAQYGQQGGQAALDLAQRFPDVNIQEYMNPYIQEVLDPALADIGRRASQERNALNARSAMTGSFGGSRNAIAQAEQERNAMQEMGRLSANTRAAGFQSAADQFRKDQAAIPGLYSAAQNLGLTGQQGIANVANLEQQQFNQLGQLAAQNTGRLASQVAPLYTAGALSQQDEQANLDKLYADFVEQRDYPARGISVLQGALGIPATALGTGTETRSGFGPAPNTFAQTAGALGGLYNSGLLGKDPLATAGGALSSLGGAVTGALGSAGNFLRGLWG
jgi:hypothetical protein